MFYLYFDIKHELFITQKYNKIYQKQLWHSPFLNFYMITPFHLDHTKIIIMKTPKPWCSCSEVISGLVSLDMGTNPTGHIAVLHYNQGCFQYEPSVT